jgi:hypothetical protein
MILIYYLKTELIILSLNLYFNKKKIENEYAF